MLSKDKARGAILGYYVLHRVKDTPPWTNESVDRAEKTSLLVGSLNEYITYEFAMQAFNSKGVSNLSALVEKTTDQHSECYFYSCSSFVNNCFSNMTFMVCTISDNDYLPYNLQYSSSREMFFHY